MTAPATLRAAYADVARPLRAHFADDSAADVQALLWRKDGRGGILRVPHPAGGTVVVKVWRIAGPRDRLKIFLGLANGQREWHRHRFMRRAGLKVPEPLFYARDLFPRLGACELMGIEDLGATERGMGYLKRLAAAGRSAEMGTFEAFIVESTCRQLRLGVLDVDNQLNNYLLAQDGRLLRTDFECARRRPFPRLWKREYAQMVDRLRRSHLHAMEPVTRRTRDFMAGLADRLDVPPAVMRLADEMTHLERQKERQRANPGSAP